MKICTTLFLFFLFSHLLSAQTWEADLTKVGQSAAGGFDYQWKNFTSSEIGTRIWTFDYTGVRTLKHAPAAGIHPRIFFNPEDTTEIRIRLNTTINGKELNRKRHAFTTLLYLGYTGGTYNSNASYAKNSLGQTYIGNVGYWDLKPIYDTFAAGDTSGYTLVRQKNGGATGAFSNMLSMEAFECLLYKNNYDPDTKLTYLARAKKLAKAMTAYAFAATCNGLNAVNYTKIGGIAFPIAYDLNYWAMTAGQRDTIRKAIVMMTPDAPRYGSNVEPYGTLSNWTALNSFEIIPNLAIEGETGYRPNLTHDWAKVFYKFVSYGFYNSGCGWEGLGKNYMNTGYQIALARRGYSMLGHPHLRAFGNNYLPALSQPFGYSFTGDDALGGSGTNVQLGKYKFSVIDAVGFKWAFPNDDGADFMWRNYLGTIVNNQEVPDYAGGGTIDPCTTSYHDYMSVLQAFVSDWSPVDFSVKAQSALKNLDFFETDRGQVIMRSDWSRNALQTIFNVRQNLGGHTNADRNSFTLSSHGRIWVPLRSAPGGAYYDVSEAHSCLFVDDSAMIITKLEGNKLRQPAKLINWSGSDNFSQATGDATYAYSWEWSWSALAAGKDNPLLGKADPGRQAWTKVSENLNTFRVNPSTESFYSIPFYDFAAWNSPAGYRETIIKRPYNVMEKVYRTMSMIRGAHSALLVVDEAKKDAKPHTYKWTMQLATDVVIESTANKGNGIYDVVLKESSGNRRLLVRMLNQSDYASGSVPAKIDTTWYTTGDGKSYKNYRLVCASNSISPDFKVLLFPHLTGEALPVTSWNSNRTSLSLNWSDQTSTVTFSSVNGLTKINYLPTAISNIKVDNSALKIFPNPAKKTITLRNVQHATVSVSDMSGREVKRIVSGSDELKMDVSDLIPSNYIVTTSIGKQIRSSKLIIQK